MLPKTLAAPVPRAPRRRPVPSGRIEAGVLPSAVAVAVAALLLIAQLHAAPATSFVWKATGKGATVYLAGSIHMLPQDAYPLHPAFERAFTDADLLVEEVDLAEMLGPEVQMQT